MPKYKCPYTYPHKSRSAMIDYITGIGGYSRHLDGTWPIEFCVSTHHADFSFEHMWEKYGEEHTPSGLNPEQLALYYSVAQREYKEHQNHLWDWGVEDASRSLHDGDCYRMLWDGTMLDVKLALHGRCGKHLVIEKFEGTDLSSRTSDDLEEGLSAGEYGWGWSYSDVRLLYKYVRQCEIDFTPEKASAEVEYQAAFCFFVNIVQSAYEEALSSKADHDTVVGCAKTLYGYLEPREGTAVVSMLTLLAAAAGVSKEEMCG